MKNTMTYKAISVNKNTGRAGMAHHSFYSIHPEMAGHARPTEIFLV